MRERQHLPVIPFAYARPIAESEWPATTQPPDDAHPPGCTCLDGGCVRGIQPLRSDDAISQAFEAARETVARLEAERVEHVGGEWSPAQVCRRAA